MKSLLATAALALGLGPCGIAQAQDWPKQPIKIVANFAPGGAADQLARVISAPLHEALGQPVLVENRGGAGGNLGGDFVAKSPPDGYTFLMSSGGMVSINPHIYAKMPFDPAKDLVPVASVARVPFYLVVRADSPVKDLKGLVADLKANPGKRSFGSPGNGSSPHLAAEMMTGQTGTTAIHVPYRGAAPALTDLLGGQIDFLFDPGISIQHVKTGKLRMLAVASLKRAPQMPEVPTLDELGLKGFDADAVFGLYAPAGTRPAVIQRINAEVNRALALPAVRATIETLGNVPEPLTSAAFGDKGAADFKRLGTVIRERGIRAD
ncbi:Bug family tripartite tricarboxylate transporter substrate binding protein [Variovorax paradoxus]|uniref:Bug family tripartite tricarboxylate transporter substrate binding protein n=1 Tax=Variovorax paradoxus TaxID=34073 RepID=UPI00278A8307|nr:tripartite tricarboxylate transporter substrate binding protein [Variovorax paradoxus]MDP9928187.1 tripartite-type tricarboxylate transporter receptor subunit TctC [Variovorax paradoxus]